MNDPDPNEPAPIIEHEPAPPAPPEPAAAAEVARRRGGTPLPLTLLLTAGLGGGLYWVWTHPLGAPAPAQAAADKQPAIDAAQAQTAAVQTQVQALAGRVDALEKHVQDPAATPAQPPAQGVSPEVLAEAAKKIDDLSGRMDALSAKQDAQAAEIQKTQEIAAQRPREATPPPPDTTASQVPALIAGQRAADMGSRLDRRQAASDEALAQQKSALDTLDQRLAKLEAGAGQGDALRQQAAAQGQAQASAQLEALNARLEKLEQGSAQAQSQEQAAAEAHTQITALGARVDKLEQGSGQVQGAAQNASRAIRLQAAEAALSSGQPLGTLPDAPPALARFATTAPPTETSLRAAFPRVAEAARAASQPDVSHRSFLDRALARVQQSVTVRRGDQVLVGDPASGVLARAQDALSAGDIRRAADVLGALNGPAAAAASSWVAQARSLVDARAALAAMARG